MDSTIDYGIDLGTTNSSIALCRDGEVRVFQSNDLMNVTPSVVYVSKSGRMLVGKRAYDIWVTDPENTQAEFKRWMGFSDRLTFAASGRAMSAEELSAEVLKALRADALRATQEQISESVITVPAAFGSLQCDATGRAAKLAGLEQCPLLQEPIAAAIAYGAGPSSKNQRWMVFDLGGGTLDIAIVSTRNDRLAVLDHQGDNRLGGKDIDRAIAESFLLPPLQETFALPDRKSQAAAFDRLYRALLRQAEQAKIALSTATTTTVDLFDLGEDSEGRQIELALPLSRGQVEQSMGSLLERCLALADRAMEGARLAKADLDRVLLVGGPTQMPILRSALESGLGAKLDYSMDPMTVVSRGAALYASTQRLSRPRAVANASALSAAAASASSSAVKIELSFERASGSVRSPVAGILPARSGVHEIKIDADGGFWTSGWVAVAGGRFMLDVMLNERKPMTQYTILARDVKGNAMAIEPSRFSVTFMLPTAAPPLPHTIAIELSDHHGRLQYDPVFKRHCPLPAEARKSYKAERTLRPSEVETTLPIKFWEIEVSEDPQERWWAGCVHIRADKIRRPIVEGSEIELTVKIDASRKMTVEVFIPMLNESFVDGVYIPEPPTARSQLQSQLEMCFVRLEEILRHIYESDRDDLLDHARALQQRLEAIAEQAGEEANRGGAGDPDAALRPTEALRKIRAQLARLEEQLNAGHDTELLRKARADLRWTERLASSEATDSEREELEHLKAQLQKYAEADDPRGIKWVQQQLQQLRNAFVNRAPWFWDNIFVYLKSPARQFMDPRQAQQHLSAAESAQKRGDFPGMRDALNKAWDLLPPDKAKVAKEQVAQSGLRGT